MSIENLLSSIISADYATAKSEFEQSISERIASALDAEKTLVAAEIYNSVTEAKKEKDEDDDEDENEDDDEDDDENEEDDDEDDADDDDDDPKGKKKVKESIELSELSRKTLASYTKKASDDYANAAGGIADQNEKDKKGHIRKLVRRNKGITRATDRLAK